MNIKFIEKNLNILKEYDYFERILKFIRCHLEFIIKKR